MDRGNRCIPRQDPDLSGTGRFTEKGPGVGPIFSGGGIFEDPSSAVNGVFGIYPRAPGPPPFRFGGWVGFGGLTTF